MRANLAIAVAALLPAASAWAQGGAAGANVAAPAVSAPVPPSGPVAAPAPSGFVGHGGTAAPATPTTPTTPTTPSTPSSTGAASTTAVVGTGGTIPPAAPPSSVTTPPSVQGVPPTPAPATAGLPAPSTTPALPSAQNLGNAVENELRPAPSASVAQVADVQAALAAGGLYRGPIDGIMSGGTRAAIRQYQTISRVPATGELDAQTLGLLTQGAGGAGVASNGNTATVGNRSAAGDPFGISLVPSTGATAGTNAATTPFPLSQQQTTFSPEPPAGVLIQP